ncbi:unnamed protein product [Fraxinus pennsylvanica]|uniref:Uncharacterized protein n=1 Tax=Fraxinus pennsylvanica TaxID=56036 RepID=A0AAD2EE51_9LAMI|nr:unnamed protein product [Fraxinus pennsylvanica]
MEHISLKSKTTQPLLTQPLYTQLPPPPVDDVDGEQPAPVQQTLTGLTPQISSLASGPSTEDRNPRTLIRLCHGLTVVPTGDGSAANDVASLGGSSSGTESAMEKMAHGCLLPIQPLPGIPPPNAPARGPVQAIPSPAGQAARVQPNLPARSIAEDYSNCEFLIRLPGYCPMPAFRDSIDVPLVVRRLHKSREEVRKELGIGEDVKVVILNFGGQSLFAAVRLDIKGRVPASWLALPGVLYFTVGCLVCGSSENQNLPPNFVKLAKDSYTPDLIAASDCMLGKIGYGTVSEALAYKVPFVFVRRDYFNEEPFLRNLLEFYQGGVEMIRQDLLTGHWSPYLERAVGLKPCYEGGTNGGEVAAHILMGAVSGKTIHQIREEQMESGGICVSLLVILSQCLSPFSFKLGERVLRKCASKLKPYLQEAVSCVDISFGEYTNIVASICQGATQRENMVVFLF